MLLSVVDVANTDVVPKGVFKYNDVRKLCTVRDVTIPISVVLFMLVFAFFLFISKYTFFIAASLFNILLVSISFFILLVLN